MTQASIRIEGLNLVIRDLQEIAGKGAVALEEVIFDLTKDTQTEAVNNIKNGARSGRLYTHHFFTDAQGRLRQGRKRGTPHRASAPGQYPADDTGRLVNDINVILPSAGMMRGVVGSNLVYAKYLEFGTSKMAARPWLLRSFEKASANLEQKLKARFEAKI